MRAQGEPHLARLHELLCLVVDEADRLVEKSHFDELLKILAVINTYVSLLSTFAREVLSINTHNLLHVLINFH